jgi:hypothetical protein
MYALKRFAGVLGFGVLLSIAIPLHAAEDDAASPDPAADEVEQLAQELDRLSDAVQRRRELDAFVRLTWRFRKERTAFF